MVIVPTKLMYVNFIYISVQVFVSIIVALSVQYASAPLLSELVVELSYPCPENVLGSIQTLCFDIVASLFLLLFMIPTDCKYLHETIYIKYKESYQFESCIRSIP